MTLGQVLEHGGDHPTGPAPRRPEIDDYGHGRSRLRRERVGVRIDEPGQLGLALRASRDSPSDRTHAIASIARRAADDRHHHYQGRGPSSRSRLASPLPPEGASAPVAVATRRTCANRSTETTRTPCSTRSTPRARTVHTTPRAPLRAHLRRRRDSHTACSRTRARWRESYVLVFVSIATAMPVGAIATESMSPRPLPRQRMP